jgi:primosomal protein N' (replication factor Y)
MPIVADVAIPVPLTRAFSYEVPASLSAGLCPGARVLCEFGRRKLIGVVLSVGSRHAPLDGVHLKPIRAVIDAEPALPAELLAFLVELAHYYAAPIGEVLRLALPAIERQAVRELKAQAALLDVDELRGKTVGQRRVLYVWPTDAVEEPGTLRGQAALVLAYVRGLGEARVAEVQRHFRNARAAIKKLEALGLVRSEEREPSKPSPFAHSAARDVPPELTEAQALGVARIEAGLGARSDAPAERAFLLFGVTGSGKTEVYLRAIARALELGKGALMMVPEIALTPQLVARFCARFGDSVGVVHSGLTDADRHAMWSRLRRGELRVAIGARSALFAPVAELGLVIVDEEHDSSYKQEDGVRYHARDMALLRAHRAGAVAVLGSATPSLESVALARRAKLALLSLPERAHRQAELPKVQIVDLRRIGPGPSGSPLLSILLHRALAETLERGEQSIVFLNRRGFAPSVVCASCGGIETCQACSVALTYHRRGPRPVGELVARGGSLRCHYCDFEGPLPKACSACGGTELLLEGLGTERLEETIAASFPTARVARLDRDVASGAKSEAILERMRRGELDILVGTQMVTKGHDLPNVTLVGVVNADSALSMPDFRAAERGFALLVQVAGRAGRHDRPGRVIIQTRSPDHPAIVYAARHDVPGFQEHELRDRHEVGYPPFSRLALLRIDAVDEGMARDAAAILAAHARTSPEAQRRLVDVLGPAAAPIARLRGRYRFRVLLRARERAPLRAVLSAIGAARDRVDARVRVVFDVDPVAML